MTTDQAVQATDWQMSTLSEIIQQCKAALAAYYGARFRGLILYGSVARGESDPTSDIDLLILLDQPFDYVSELRQIIDILYPVQLDSPWLISAKPVPVGDFERGAIQLYRNITHSTHIRM
ncbi:nucleotidyltransferase family protein [Chloroflexus islandicus]|nr:nucleotidyltransferase domain-containing protein [Chloroflexus islandicus]